MTISRLSEAINAHAVWVGRFESAVSRFGSELPSPEELRDDTACEFGRWLHENPELLGPDRYLSLVNLHRAFHEEAARIAEELQRHPASTVSDTLKSRMDYLSRRLIDSMLDAERELRVQSGAADFALPFATGGPA